jgi:hypothetical protein
VPENPDVNDGVKVRPLPTEVSELKLLVVLLSHSYRNTPNTGFVPPLAGADEVNAEALVAPSQIL